jgi:hypothetical protein
MNPLSMLTLFVNHLNAYYVCQIVEVELEGFFRYGKLKNVDHLAISFIVFSTLISTNSLLTWLLFVSHSLSPFQQIHNIDYINFIKFP